MATPSFDSYCCPSISVADVLSDTSDLTVQLVLKQYSGSACSGVGATVTVQPTVQVLVLQYRLCVQVSSASGLHNTDYMYSGVYSTVTDASK